MKSGKLNILEPPGPLQACNGAAAAAAAFRWYVYIQGITGGTDQTSGECSLGQTIPI